MTTKTLIKKLNNSHSFKWHVKKLDEVFSIFIRTRNADENGYIKCFTCGKIAHWKEMDCGHYISRKHLSLRWDETNCNTQCKKCNLFSEGNKPEYALNLQKKYGINILEILNIQKNSKSKIGIPEMRMLIKFYQDFIRDYKK